MLGRGGMGVVYKAHDRVLNETVAIKVLREDVAGSTDMGRRFLAEIKMARSVSHRNVCRIHEYGQDGDVRYISMAFVDGVDLKQVLRERGPLPPAEAFDLAISVADGLQAIHEEGIIHRDLKTPNLMLDARGVVRLMDFGIAKQWTDSAGASLTGTGMIVGTPEYMSPEQVLGHKLDLRSDLYALGVVVHELFTGQTPFQAETPVALLMKHIHDPPALDSLALPPALVPVLSRALAKDRDQRHSSAAEMADALREARRATLGTAATPRPVPLSAPTTVVSIPSLPATLRPAPTDTHVPETVTSVSRRPASPPARRSLLLPLLAGGALVLMAAAALIVLLVVRARPQPSLPPPAAAATATPAPASPAVAATPPPSAPAQQAAVAAAPVASAPAKPAARATQPKPGAAASVEVQGLLAEAETAFAAQQHKAALEFYEQALKLDPASERARIGRDLCASALAQDAAAHARPARAFTAGRTQVTGRPAPPAAPAGFESSSGVAVKPVDRAAEAPGKLAFDVEPPAVRAGEPFVVRVYLVNEGAAPLRLSDAAVATTTDGRTASGPVALLAREAPPRQRTLILSTSGQWRAEVESWSLAVTVRAASGETYRNELAWR